MRKKLSSLLASAFILGMATVSFASPVSQFSDVPAKSWAYNAITTLAQAGIVDGYGDGTFRGDKTMTRYEMAQIVVNAMTKVDKADAANKAIIDKLAVEFSAELQTLNARVTTVEKNQGNVTFSGDARVRWVKWDNIATTHPYHNGTVQTNYSLVATDRVNDDVTGTLRMYLMRNNVDGNPAAAVGSPNTNEANNVMEAKFEVKNFLGQKGTTVTAGRFAQTFGATGYIANLYGVDGAKIDFGNKLKVQLGAADFSNPLSNFTKDGTNANEVVSGALYFKDAAFAKLTYNTSKATQLQAFYVKNTSGATVANIYDLGVASTVAPNLVFKAEYLKNNAFDEDNTNKQFVIMYRGADVSKPGTWGIGGSYGIADAKANFGWGDYNPITMWPMADLKSWNAKVEYALMKNVSFRACQTFNSKVAETGAKAPNGEWTRVEFNFFF
jgi:hypothetical protein